jgi:hypothetical protein
MARKTGQIIRGGPSTSLVRINVGRGPASRRQARGREDEKHLNLEHRNGNLRELH